MSPTCSTFLCLSIGIQSCICNYSASPVVHLVFKTSQDQLGIPGLTPSPNLFQPQHWTISVAGYFILQVALSDIQSDLWLSSLCFVLHTQSTRRSYWLCPKHTHIPSNSQSHWFYPKHTISYPPTNLLGCTTKHTENKPSHCYSLFISNLPSCRCFFPQWIFHGHPLKTGQIVWLLPSGLWLHFTSTVKAEGSKVLPIHLSLILLTTFPLLI